MPVPAAPAVPVPAAPATGEAIEYIEPLFLLQVVELQKGLILNRPSKIIRFGLVADILLEATGEEILGYTPPLGSTGLVEALSEVYLTAYPDTVPQQPTTCSHSVFLAVMREVKGEGRHSINEQVIGILPKIANELVECAIELNYCTLFKDVKQLRRNVPMVVEGKINSVFDFCGICHDGVPFLLKVTNVTSADYEDWPPEELRSTDFTSREVDTKVAYYPGHKVVVDAESLRAIKDLTTIKSESVIRCALCYVVERTDVDRFQISKQNPEYNRLVQAATDAGVLISTIMVGWTREGVAYFIRDDLPINDVFDPPS